MQGERAMIYCSKPSMCFDPALKLAATEGQAFRRLQTALKEHVGGVHGRAHELPEPSGHLRHAGG